MAIDFGEATGIAKKWAKQLGSANVEFVNFKEVDSNGNNVYTWHMTDGTNSWTWDMTTNSGVDSFLGVYPTLLEYKTAYPTGVKSRFSYIYKSTEDGGDGVVSVCYWDDINNDYYTLKLNQSIPSAEIQDMPIGFVGTKSARLALINNADYNTKIFEYYDTDVKIGMLYQPESLKFKQYRGQKCGLIFPLNPVDESVFIGTELVYQWNDTDQYYKIILDNYVRKHEPEQGGYTTHVLNGAELRIHRDASDNMWISVHQNIGMDTLLYSLDDSITTRIVLSQDDEEIIVQSNIDKGNEHLLTTELAHDGNGQSIKFIRYENTIFVVQDSKILVGDTTFTSMTTSERLIYLADTNKTKKRFVFDTDLGVLMQFIPNVGHIGSFVEYKGQSENGSFPYATPTNGQSYISNGNSYTYNSASQYWSLNVVGTSLKNNMTATVAPTVNDDSGDGYSAGSIWVQNSSITYTCQDATLGAAVWISDADITYFDDWSSAVSAISVAGSTFIQKYISVTNANGAPNSGATYTAPGAIGNPIADGGTAVYKVTAQGMNYSVTCQKRAINNPILNSMVKQGDALPSIASYYGFLGTPSGGYPSGISQGDIGFYDGSSWSRYQTYSNANNSVLVGSGANQIIWVKNANTWIKGTHSGVANSIPYFDGAGGLGDAGIQYTSIVTLTTAQPLSNKTFTDSTTAFADDADSSKKAKFECGGITTGNTRTLSVPDVNLTIDGIPTSWNYNTKYISGMRISYSNTILQATSTHTSSGSSFIADFQSGKWLIVGGNLLQVTYAQRTSISTPYNGMNVYQTDSQTNYPIGEYIYLNGAWKLLVDDSSIQTLSNKTLMDNSTTFVDNGNSGRKAQLECSNITIGNTITLTVPDASITIDGMPQGWVNGVKYLQGMRAMSGNTILRANSYHVSSSSIITDIQAGKWIIDGGGLFSMTQAQRLGISSPYNGMEVYQTDGVVGKYTYKGTIWTFEPIISDNTSSGYFDIGSMRMQWGNGYGYNQDPGTVNLPVSFANSNYSVTATMNSSGDATFAVNIYGQSTSGFAYRKRYTNGGTTGAATSETFNWIAIGMKP